MSLYSRRSISKSVQIIMYLLDNSKLPISRNKSILKNTGISFVNEDEIALALKSQLRPVSTSLPIAKDTATGIQIYPQVTQTGFYNYLRRPLKPVYGYTTSGRTITYDNATSTQLEFTDVYINNIISINTKENMLIKRNKPLTHIASKGIDDYID